MILAALAGPWAVIAAFQSPAAPAAPELALAPRPEITRAELEAHVRFLASDELRGRSTGTPEAERAARYLARVLERTGLEPAGDGGTFLQAVPLERSLPGRGELVLTTRSGELVRLEAGRDFDPPPFEVELPTLEIVSIAGESEVPAEARAETALFLDLPTSQRRKRLEAAGHAEGRGFDLLLVPGRTQTRTSDTGGRRGSLHLVSDAPPGVPSIRVHGAALERLRAGEFKRVAIASKTSNERVAAWNVVARIPGAGKQGSSALAGEAVVFSAHYDHLPDAAEAASKSKNAPSGGEEASTPGEPPPAGGESRVASSATGEADRIHNGADDDASGCAAVLELAGAFASGVRPARTLVFLLVTGEEIGLLGTRHYLDRPVVALDRTVANLNYEMIGRPDELVGGAGKLWLTGFERTNLGAAYAELHLPIVADPRPAEKFFERSDNYAFVMRGIVGQTFSSYNLHTDYHRPSDEVSKIDFAHMEAAVRSAYEAARPVAAGELTPAWLPGAKPATR